MHENTHVVNFSDCFGIWAQSDLSQPAKLQATIDYYEKECKENPKSEFIDTYSGITCFTVDGALLPKECKKLIQRAEDIGFKDLTSYRKGYRDNQRVVLRDVKSARILFSRVKHLLPQEITVVNSCDGGQNQTWVLSHLNPLMRFGKYNQNDAFAAHKDAGFGDSRSKAMLTIMFYLNAFTTKSGDPSGRTRMLTLNKTCKKSEDDKCTVLDAVVPAPGRCVIFNQYSIYHDGESVKDCLEPKYILRTDIMYQLKR
jgi:hypothetical protein